MRLQPRGSPSPPPIPPSPVRPPGYASGSFVEKLALELIRSVGTTLAAWLSMRALLSAGAELGSLLRANHTREFGSLVANCSTRFDDVLGVDEVKAELREAVAFLRDPHAFARLGAQMPRGVLLEGPPGTGKTLLARAVAGEAGVPFLSASASSFDEKYVGVGASRVRALFAAARKLAPAIIFIDEIDSVGASRYDESRALHAQTLNALLVEMDGFAQNQGLVVIAATNQARVLDKALVRPGRFDRILSVPPPDINGRRALLHRLASRYVLAEDVDLELLATQTAGLTGAHLANILNLGALAATSAGKPAVDAAALLAARDKVLFGLARPSAHVTEKERALKAVHEAGHVLVARHTPHAARVEKVTIVPYGNGAGGLTMLHADDDALLDHSQLRARIDVLMGGRAAELVEYGEEGVTTGAEDDLRKARTLALRMSTHWGLGEALGPAGCERPFEQLSPRTHDALDLEVGERLRAAQARAVSLLLAHRDELRAVSKALLAQDTLSAAQLDEVLSTTLSGSEAAVESVLAMEPNA